MSCSKIKNVVFFWATRGTPKPNLMKQGHKNFVFFPAKCMFLTGLTQLVGARLNFNGLEKLPHRGFMDMHDINLIMIL